MSWADWIRSWWPMEESVPSNRTLLVIATVPFFALTVLAHTLGASLWMTGVGAFVLALGVRVLPYFKRPESYHLNALGGWVLGEILNTVLWRRTPGF